MNLTYCVNAILLTLVSGSFWASDLVADTAALDQTVSTGEKEKTDDAEKEKTDDAEKRALDHQKMAENEIADIQDGIHDFFNRSNTEKMKKDREAYDKGLVICPKESRKDFLKKVLEALRWLKEVPQSQKDDVRKKTTEYGADKKPIYVDLDVEVNNAIASGNYNKISNVMNKLKDILKEAKSGKLVKKSKDLGNKFKKKKSLLDDYGGDYGGGYDAGGSGTDELDVEYSLDEDLEGFRVHDIEYNSDGIDTTKDWEKLKDKDGDSKISQDADTYDADGYSENNENDETDDTDGE